MVFHVAMRRWTGGLLVILLAGGWAAPRAWSADDGAAEIEALKKDLEALRKRLAKAASAGEKKEQAAGDAGKKSEKKKKDGGAKTEKKKKATPPTPPTPPKLPTYKIEKGPFKIEVNVKGAFEAQKMTELVLRPKTWKSLEILEAVQQGARVKKGQVLVKLDFEKLDEAIADLEKNNELSDAALKRAEEDLRLLEKRVPLDLAAAQRANKVAGEDLKLFLDVNKERTTRMVNFMVTYYQQQLENQEEELKQLEKMYQSDDLVEETEEIILKRQRFWVKAYRFFLKDQKISRDQTLNVFLPRQEKTLRENAAKLAVAWDKAKTTLPMGLVKKRLDLAKLKRGRAKALKKLAKLKRDRAAMKITAPSGGLLYYGPCERGKWPQAVSLSKTLRRGGRLQPHKVFMTIVQPRPMIVRAEAPEKDLQYLRPGLEGKASPAGWPETKLKAKLKEVSLLPVAPGKYDAKLSFDGGKDAQALLPGMACQVKFVPYKKKDALTVPAKSLFTDELDDEKHYVWFYKKGAKPQKHYVTIGKKTKEKVEILKGLKAGDEILLKKPEKKKAKDKKKKKDERKAAKKNTNVKKKEKP